MLELAFAVMCIMAILKVIFSIYQIIKKRFEKFPVAEFENLDRKKGDVCIAIDVLYGNAEKMRFYHSNGVLLKRRAYLINQLRLGDDMKSVASVFIASLLSGLMTKLMDWQDIKTLLQAFADSEVIVTILSIVGMLLFYALVSLLFENGLKNNENFDSQVSRYEMKCLNKVIENHISEQFSDTKVLECKKVKTSFMVDVSMRT